MEFGLFLAESLCRELHFDIISRSSESWLEEFKSGFLII